MSNRPAQNNPAPKAGASKALDFAITSARLDKTEQPPGLPLPPSAVNPGLVVFFRLRLPKPHKVPIMVLVFGLQ